MAANTDPRVLNYVRKLSEYATLHARLTGVAVDLIDLLEAGSAVKQQFTDMVNGDTFGDTQATKAMANKVKVQVEALVTANQGANITKHRELIDLREAFGAAAPTV